MHFNRCLMLDYKTDYTENTQRLSMECSTTAQHLLTGALFLGIPIKCFHDV